MSTCEPDWSLVGPINHGNLPTSHHRLVLTKEKSPLDRTMLTYRRMTNYLPEVPRSHTVHLPRRPWRPYLENGHLANPACMSTSRGTKHGENPAGVTGRQCRLMNTRLTRRRAFILQYHLCTHSSGPPPLRT